MKSAVTLAAALALCTPLMACSMPAPPAPPAPPPPPAPPAPKGFLARQVDRALDEARKELHEGTTPTDCPRPN